MFMIVLEPLRMDPLNHRWCEVRHDRSDGDVDLLSHTTSLFQPQALDSQALVSAPSPRFHTFIFSKRTWPSPCPMIWLTPPPLSMFFPIPSSSSSSFRSLARKKKKRKELLQPTPPQLRLQPLRFDAFARLVEEFGRHSDPALFFEAHVHVVER